MTNRFRRMGWLGLLLGAMALAGAALANDERGVGVRLRVGGGSDVDLYTGSHALVIGASAYRAGLPRLPGVAGDVEAVRSALERAGFAVETVLDPDRARLVAEVEKFINAWGQDPGNRLLVYFAGHGYTARQAYGEEMGYIAPVDAPSPERDRAGFLARAVDMQQVEVWAKRIQSKHALFLFDSCFSGAIFSLGRAVPEAISYKTAQPVRQFITSGSADETVPDRSVFKDQFVEALGGAADANRDGYVTGTELGEYLQDRVTNYSKGSQHPQYGKIRSPYLDKGDFVFPVASVPPPPPDLSKEQAALEALRRQQAGGAGPGGAGASRSREQLAQEAYGEAARLNTEAAWQSVATSFAGTRWADLAKDKLFELEQGRKALAAERARQEREAEEAAGREKAASIGRVWEQTRKADTKEAYGSFVERYRSEALAASHVAQARSRLGELERQASARPMAPDVTTIGAASPTGLTNSLGMTFVRVPAGSFAMGSENGDSDEKPVHPVTISRAFELQATEVTQGQWEAVMGNKPSRFQGESLPVEQVSWNDVQEFLRKLNQRDPGKGYRLPTEAEWEYACRAGTTGDRYGDLNSIAWYTENSGGKTHPVGQKQPNAWGLYDMLGNVWEWCSDWYGDYPSGSVTDPRGPSSGSSRVLRGGGWGSGASICRSANRSGYAPGIRYSVLGFRLARGQ